MIDPSWFFLGMAIPGLLAQGFYVTYCWPLKSPKPGRPQSAWAIGPGAGFVLGCQAVGGLIAGTGEYRLLMYLLPAIVLLGVIAAMGWLKGAALDGVKAAVCFAAPAVLFVRMYTGDEPQWGAGTAAAWIAGLGAWMAVSWIGVAKLDHEENGRINAFVVGLITALSAALITFSGSAKLGLMTGTLAFCAGCVWAVSWLTDRRQATQGFEATVLPVLLCMLMLSAFFSELPLWQAGVVGAAPLILWLQNLPMLKAKKVKGQIAAAALAIGVVVAVVVCAGMEYMRAWEDEGHGGETTVRLPQGRLQEMADGHAPG